MIARWKTIRAAAALATMSIVTSVTTCSAQDLVRPGDSGSLLTKRVSLNLENADIRYGLKLLFQAAGVNYTLDSGVQGSVTVSLSDVPFRTALESMLRTVQSQIPITYRVENGVYNVGLKREDPQPPAIEDIETDKPVRNTMKVARINLNFADPADITAALGGTMLPSRFADLMGGGFGGGMGGGFGGGMNGGMNGGMGAGMGSGFGGGMNGGFGNGMGSGFGSGFGGGSGMNRGSGMGSGMGGGMRGGGMGGLGGGRGNGLGGNSGIGIINIGSGSLGQFGASDAQTGASGAAIVGQFSSGFDSGTTANGSTGARLGR